MKFSIGFTTKLLNFKINFSKVGMQKVQIIVSRSDPYLTISGVSEGSSLGPTQFIIMVNDLPQVGTVRSKLTI